MTQQLRHIDIEGEDRRTGLGGSDSQVVLNVSPFKARKELWQEKMGLVEVKELDSPAIKRGKTLESIVADLYAQVKGRKVEVVKQKLVHPKHPFIYAHIDRMIMDDHKKGPGVLEIKCPGLAVFSKCQREGIQEYYIVQIQKYLGITGYKWGAFAIFSAERWELLEFDVTPNPELIKLIFTEDEKFWRYVQSGEEPPEPEVKTELELVGPNEITNMEKIDPDLWADLVKKYAEAKAMEDEASAQKELYEEKLKAEMIKAGATVAEGGGARIYFRDQAGRMSLDKKAFAKGSPQGYEIYESFLRQGKPSRPFRFYETRPITHE
ncbi:MAG: YqaJ viral recombinase family protein [Candidatus Methanoperedens sp.]|nr:YqaJ viral recombinase family protein [Candidatus Methanoperedens sp.]